jgi:glutathione S-transferase
MKLISLDHSPYAARVRILIRKKRLQIPFVSPPETFKTEAFAEAHPLGKIPLLELGDGDFLPESVAIMEYLEDIHPDSPMRPASSMERAYMRAMCSFSDTHFGPALFPLYRALINPSSGVEPEMQIQALRRELVKLEHWLTGDEPFRSRGLHLGDIALIPSVWYATVLLPLFGVNEILAEFVGVEDWWSWVNDDPDISQSIEEMDNAFRGFAATLNMDH